MKSERERERESPGLDLPARCFCGSAAGGAATAESQPAPRSAGRGFPWLSASPESLPPPFSFKTAMPSAPPPPSPPPGEQWCMAEAKRAEMESFFVLFFWVSFFFFAYACVCVFVCACHASKHGNLCMGTPGFSQ